ncbi:fibronectin type III domain-containing protein, partial [Patescibacteria group bacterium]|nr:fibronectin type III domain-containing protein [Patescibacteria group bacterium]
VCGDQSPAGAPRIFKIIRRGDQATIYFVPALQPVTSYYLSYSLKPGEDRYGVEFSQGHSTGALAYTVKHLSSSRNYYFHLRAGNGCMPGPWSDWYPHNNLKTTTTIQPKKVSGNSQLPTTTATPAPLKPISVSTPTLVPRLSPTSRPSVWQIIKAFFLHL